MDPATSDTISFNAISGVSGRHKSRGNYPRWGRKGNGRGVSPSKTGVDGKGIRVDKSGLGPISRLVEVGGRGNRWTQSV